MGIFREAFNKEPAMVLSGILFFGSMLMPLTIVPIRRRMGLSTHMYDADPKTHPMLMHYGENYVRHKFDDPTLLAKWSQHKPYRYSERLTPKTAEERDFPEARARLAAVAAEHALRYQ